MEFSRYLKHTHYSSADGRGCAPVDGPVIPSGAEIAYKPITPRRRDSLTSVGSQDAVCFGRYALHAGGDRAGDFAGGCWGRFSDGNLSPMLTSRGSSHQKWDSSQLQQRIVSFVLADH